MINSSILLFSFLIYSFLLILFYFITFHYFTISPFPQIIKIENHFSIMNESLMKIPLLLVFLIYFSECVTVTVNTTSTYAFKDRVIKAESLYINNEEFLLILFKNGSITKLNNKL